MGVDAAVDAAGIAVGTTTATVIIVIITIVIVGYGCRRRLRRPRPHFRRLVGNSSGGKSTQFEQINDVALFALFTVINRNVVGVTVVIGVGLKLSRLLVLLFQ